MRKINKMCSFYVNDWHLTVMMLPYINGKLQENEKVTIISEENLLNNINTILERTNIKEEYKKQIQTIGWEKTSQKEIMPVLMGAIASASRQNLMFSKDEFELIFKIMKEGKSETEKARMDDMLSQAQRLFNK